MIQFLSLLYQAATEYSVQLIAAGFTQDKIDQINILQSELTTADYNQELSKKRRPLLTQQRIEKLNECYEFMQNVSKAGKIIYSADFAKYEQYLLPYERTQKTDESAETSEEEPVV